MNYKNLRIYQLANKLRKELYQELIVIPHYWNIKEVGQAISSSSSSVSNIVEGFGRKFYQKEFFRFLDMSMASSDETQDHVTALGIKGHLDQIRADYFENGYKTLAIQTLNMMNVIRKNEKF
ncbi:four helix bundle protein [Candidatus Peregrinibacteria bacterium]|nr:four helix bundle protein [Candidatus Peregrinibacteria bacterium]